MRMCYEQRVCSIRLLINERAHVSKRRMPPLSIIVHFEILKKGLPGLFMGGVDLVAYTFLFEGTEETLHRRVIPTIPFTRHTDHCSHLLEARPIGLAGVLAAPITVMQEPRFGAATRHSHIQSIFCQGFIAVGRHRPANNCSRIQVQHHSQIELSLCRWDRRDGGWAPRALRCCQRRFRCAPLRTGLTPFKVSGSPVLSCFSVQFPALRIPCRFIRTSSVPLRPGAVIPCRQLLRTLRHHDRFSEPTLIAISGTLF